LENEKKKRADLQKLRTKKNKQNKNKGRKGGEGEGGREMLRYSTSSCRMQSGSQSRPNRITTNRSSSDTVFNVDEGVISDCCYVLKSFEGGGRGCGEVTD
jgi:hypothetical protein